MESKTKIPFRYIAGGCFAASAIIYFINNCLHYHVFKFNLNYISLVLAFAVIAVGLFLSVPMVSAAGSNLFLINQAAQLSLILPISASVLSHHPIPYGFMRQFIQVLVLTTFALLLLITCLNRRSAKITGIIAAAIRFILAIYIFSLGGSMWGMIIQPLLECAGAVFLGFAFSGLKDKPKAAAAAPKAFGMTDTYEKLTQLKELLDKGIITQEEFEAKKKDILGS